MKDDLGDRMKHQYEDRTRYFLPRRTYTILRLDGKAFHTFTRKMNKPFDDHLADELDLAAYSLCSEAMGIRFGYLQSDEMSFLMTDFEKITTEPWFDGNIQKICSVAASIVTAGFNAHYAAISHGEYGYFDARVFTIPDPVEVENYFIWRQKDCLRNSVSMISQSAFSHKELQGLKTETLKAMLYSTGKEWASYPPRHTRGRVMRKEQARENGTERTRWVSVPAPIFTEDRTFLRQMIPTMAGFDEKEL